MSVLALYLIAAAGCCAWLLYSARETIDESPIISSAMCVVIALLWPAVAGAAVVWATITALDHFTSNPPPR